MNRKMKAGAGVTLLALVGALAGCGEPAGLPVNDSTVRQSGDLHVEVIEVNGRQIACVVYSDVRKGGVSCDFTRDIRE